ncbi:MAG: septum formation initiator family protein [Sporolactobacillus sp.]
MADVRMHVTPLQTEYLQSQQIVEKRKEKRRRGLFRRLTVFTVLFTIVCVVMAVSLISQSREINSVVKQKQTLEKQIAASTDNAKKLKQHIKLLHNKQYIGEIARHDYLLSKKGEIIFSKPGNK